MRKEEERKCERNRKGDGRGEEIGKGKWGIIKGKDMTKKRRIKKQGDRVRKGDMKNKDLRQEM